MKSNDLATAYAIPPALGEQLDAIYGREDEDEEDPIEAPGCPLLREAHELSQFLFLFGDEESATALNRDPWNGLDHDSLRSQALYLLRQIDRYLAARKERFGIEPDDRIPHDVVVAEKRKCVQAPAGCAIP